MRLVNDHDLEKACIYGKEPVVVAFMAYDSTPCRHFFPEFKAVAADLEPRASFFIVEVQENPSITEFHGVVAVPTTIFFRDGYEVIRYEGPYKRDSLKKRIQDNLLVKRTKK